MHLTLLQIEDQMLNPVLTLAVVDGDPSVAPEPYAFLHLDMTYLPRGMNKEEWTVMEMIPGYVEPPPPPPPSVRVGLFVCLFVCRIVCLSTYL